MTGPKWADYREHMMTTIERVGRFRGIKAEIEARQALRVLEDDGLMDALITRLHDAGLLVDQSAVILDGVV